MTLLNAGRWELTPGECRVYGQNVYTGGARCTVQSGTTFDGAAAVMACDTTVTFAAASYLYRYNLSTPSEGLWHFKFQFDAAPDSASLDYWIFRFGYSGSPGAVSGLWLQLHSTDAVNSTLQLSIAGSQVAVLHDGQALSAATEYNFQVRLKYLAPGHADGLYLYQVKLDGSLLWTGFVTARDIGSGGDASVGVNAWGFGRDTAGTAIGTIGYYTAFTFNDTAGSVNNKWPGTLEFSSLVPNGAGSNLPYTAWVNDYTAIDESPVSGTDHVNETTVNDKEGWTMSTATVSNVRALVSVLDWQRVVVIGGGGPTGIKFLTWDGAEHATAEFTAEFNGVTTFAQGEKGQAIIMPTQPSDGSAWDQSTIDALEHGVQLTTTTAGTATRVYAQRTYVITGAEGPELDDIRPFMPSYGYSAA